MAGKTRNLLTAQGNDGSRADPRLDPQLERARAKLLNGLGDLSLSEALAELKAAIETQKTEGGRLANLSAQTWVLRRQLEALRANQVPGTVQSLIGPSPARSANMKLMALVPSSASEPPLAATQDPGPVEVSDSENPKTWRKVRVLAEAEVNGMVFFEGSLLAVKPEDAARLVEAGKAEIIEAAGANAAEAPKVVKSSKGKRSSKVGE